MLDPIWFMIDPIWFMLDPIWFMLDPIWFMLDPIWFMLDPINLPDKDSAQLTTYISSGSLTRVISNFLILFTRSCNTLECFVKLTKKCIKLKFCVDRAWRKVLYTDNEEKFCTQTMKKSSVHRQWRKVLYTDNEEMFCTQTMKTVLYIYIKTISTALYQKEEKLSLEYLLNCQSIIAWFWVLPVISES